MTPQSETACPGPPAIPAGPEFTLSDRGSEVNNTRHSVSCIIKTGKIYIINEKKRLDKYSTGQERKGVRGKPGPCFAPLWKTRISNRLFHSFFLDADSR